MSVAERPWRDAEEAAAWLQRHVRERENLESVTALLHWDQRTTIPSKGHAHRSEVVAQLAGMSHERKVAPLLGEALAYLEGGAAAQDPEAPGWVDPANLREWRRDYDRAAKIPQDLAVELARCCSLAETAWEAARPANDWAGFLPHLERLLALKRQEAEAVGYASEPYDALLDDYEPGERAAALQPLFAELRQGLVALLARLKEAPRRPNPALLQGDFPVDAQREFSLEVARALGYDLEAGRLDSSAHPFSITIGPGDSRITTRFDPRSFSQAFFSTMHEVGHALYEQGLPAEAWGTPLGQAASLGVHESQSRLWENLVARSEPFWRHFLPLAQARFPALGNVPLAEFLGAVNEVRPGLIRVDADEVTYNLHVMLRFELELALFRGELQARDLPEAWDAAMERYLGLRPPDLASGVLQDVHWSAGLFGYFPTYTLGNLYAAQLFAAAQRELGPQVEPLARGECAPLLHWLRDKVHCHGRRYAPRELVRRATGEELSPRSLLAYLEGKFTTLYGV